MRTTFMMFGRLVLSGILYLLLLVCLSVHQVRPGAPAADPLTRLAYELPQWSNHPTLGPAVQKVQAHLSDYSDWRRQAETIRGRDSMKLFIIGQTHMPPNLIRIGRAEILTSQHNVYTLLSRLKPSVICLEGSYGDQVNAVRVLGRSKGRERQNFLAEMGTIKYLEQYPTIPAVGADDSCLHKLALKIIDVNPKVEDVGPQALRDFDRLYLSVLDARSQVAVDRSVLGLQRHHRQYAALVIGDDHRQACLTEANRLQLKTGYARANTYVLLDKP